METKEQAAEKYAEKMEVNFGHSVPQHCKTAFLAGVEWAQKEGLIKTTEQLPARRTDKSYSQVPCLCYLKGEQCILVFNHEHA